MNTFFNVRQKETSDLMREQLKRIVVPRLREMGFKGQLPSFRRVKEGRCQALDIQFNKYGGSFAVNLSLIEPSEDFSSVRYADLNVLRSQRLGTRRKRIRRQFNMDHWFKFLRGWIFYWSAYDSAAHAVVVLLDAEADAIYEDLAAAVQKGISCIHLDSPA